MNALSLSDKIAAAALLASAVSLLISIAALLVAVFSVRMSNRNSSAAILVILNEGFCQAWRRFISVADDTTKQYEFSELMNLFEVACAIYLEGTIYGVSRKLFGAYADRSLSLLTGSADAQERLKAALDTPDTFEYVREYMKKRGIVSRPTS